MNIINTMQTLFIINMSFLFVYSLLLKLCIFINFKFRKYDWKTTNIDIL